MYFTMYLSNTGTQWNSSINCVCVSDCVRLFGEKHAGVEVDRRDSRHSFIWKLIIDSQAACAEINQPRSSRNLIHKLTLHRKPYSPGPQLWKDSISNSADDLPGWNYISNGEKSAGGSFHDIFGSISGKTWGNPKWSSKEFWDGYGWLVGAASEGPWQWLFHLSAADVKWLLLYIPESTTVYKKKW